MYLEYALAITRLTLQSLTINRILVIGLGGIKKIWIWFIWIEYVEYYNMSNTTNFMSIQFRQKMSVSFASEQESNGF